MPISLKMDFFSESDLTLIRRINELHMDWPFAGTRILSRLLNREGQPAGRRHISTLMKLMGIHALLSYAQYQQATSGTQVQSVSVT
ncbi:MAG: IS3 family transposase [Candidatus Nitrotoga sp.]